MMLLLPSLPHLSCYLTEMFCSAKLPGKWKCALSAYSVNVKGVICH